MKCFTVQTPQGNYWNSEIITSHIHVSFSETSEGKTKKTLLISTHKQQHSKRVKMYVKLMSFAPWQRTILSWSNKMKHYTLKNHACFLEIMYLPLGNISWEPWLYIWAFTWLTDWRTGSIVYKKGWADYFLRKLRTFNLCSKMLEIYYLSVVASAIHFPVVCYASS